MCECQTECKHTFTPGISSHISWHKCNIPFVFVRFSCSLIGEKNIVSLLIIHLEAWFLMSPVYVVIIIIVLDLLLDIHFVVWINTLQLIFLLINLMQLTLSTWILYTCYILLLLYYLDFPQWTQLHRYTVLCCWLMQHSWAVFWGLPCRITSRTSKVKQHSFRDQYSVA